MSIKICQSCGISVSATQKFCSKCGTKLFTDDQRFCSKCNGSIPDGAKFCVRCGTRAPLSDEEIEEQRIAEEEEKKRIELEKEMEQTKQEAQRKHHNEMLQRALSILQEPPQNDDIDAYITYFDELRKSDLELDAKKKLNAYLNGSSTILTNYNTRPYLIKALQGLDEAFILATQLGEEKLANQIRFILIKLNIQFGDLIPKPSNRQKYYNEANKIIQELKREIEDGDIVGKDTIMVYMLLTEVHQRRGNLKQAIISVETARQLALENKFLEEEVKLLNARILVHTARYDEALELLKEIDENNLQETEKKVLLSSHISYLLGDYDNALMIMEKLVDDPRLMPGERIKMKKEMTNIYLNSNNDKAVKTFDSIFIEELDPVQEKTLKEIEENIKSKIKRDQISQTIKLNNANTDFRDRLNAMREAQGRENWTSAINNGRRLIEILDDYHQEIDPGHEKEAEINFRLGDALFNHQEYEQAYAYYEKSIQFYEDGIGEKTQHPTALKKLVDTQIQLGQYQRAYDNASKGLELAQEISHPGLIKELSEVVEKLNPERIQHLQAFNLFIINSITGMADRNSFYRLYQILQINANTVDQDVGQFLSLTMGVLRLSGVLPVALFQVNPLGQIVNSLVEQSTNLRPLWLNPAGVFQEIPNFQPFIPFIRNMMPINKNILLIGVMAGLTYKVIMENNQPDVERIPQLIMNRLQRGLTQGEVASLILAALIKAVEISVEI